MNNKNNILLSILVLFSTHSNFAMMNNDSRYTTIIESFNPQTNSFNQEFTSDDLDKDIRIIQEHKQSFEKELANYKTSWAPTLLKLLAAGFGVEAGLSAMHGTIFVEGRLNRLLDMGNGEITRLITSTHPISHYIISAIYPIHYASATLTNPIATKLYNMLFKQRSIDINMYDLGMSAVYITSSLINAAIAKYLFNKAADYKNKTSELEKRIELDDKIIKALEDLKNQ